jgi:hypothetical protein
MIKISQHLQSAGRIDPEAYLETQADTYWQKLNPSKSGSYTPTALVSVIRKYRDLAGSLNPKYVLDYANDDQFVALVHRDFFNEVLAQSALLLKNIIVSDPAGLDSIKNNIKIKFPDEIFFTLDGSSKVQTDFGKLLSEKIFNYSKFRSSRFCLQYLRSLSFDEVFCPYCGYQPVELVGVNTANGDPEKALLDLDHFFSKAEFPYLAISLFNLIPCCHTCNSRYKLTKEFGFNTHIHPYAESFDDHFSFSIQLTPKGRRVSISSAGHSTKTQSAHDLGLAERYEKKKKLLKLETDYKQVKKCRDQKSLDDFVKYMLKDVPLTQPEIISECLGKAKRDILRSIDAFNLLRPSIK